MITATEKEACLPLALRFWPEFQPQSEASASGPKKSRKKRQSGRIGREMRVGQRVLVFDTETGTDEVQSLRFGFWRIYFQEVCEQEGVFLADDLEEKNPEDAAIVRALAEKFGLGMMRRAEFVERIFYPEVRTLGTLCVGFNLPFDLSRIASRYTAGEGRFRDCFSLYLSSSQFKPGIRVRPFNSHACGFEFLKARPSLFKENKPFRGGERRPFRGRFLDLHTLCYALSQESRSLRSAGEAFGADTLKEQAPGQGDDEDGHGGALTPEYLQYARQDVAATYSLYLALSDAYSRFPFATSDPEEQRQRQGSEDTPITDLYSPASIAKAMFRKMGLKPTLLPPQYLGYAMSAFYGPRVEVRIRNREVPITLLDFTSQYSAAFTLLDLWPTVTAKRVEPEEDTERVRELLARIAAEPETLFDKEAWKELAGYAQVIPDGDFLPCRVKWPGEPQPSLSVCPVTSEQPLWYALPDLAASVLLTGKAPHVLRAFRARGSGVQQKLRGVSLGGSRLESSDPAFFVRVVEHRKRLDREAEALERESRTEEARIKRALASGAKAIANSGCYGIFAEFNPQPITVTREVGEKGRRRQARSGEKAVIYSDTSFDYTFRKTVEKPGAFTNPYLAALVTAGGRLLLAMAEREAGSFGWMATDAIAVVDGDAAAMQEQFQSLSPYDPEIIPRFLKLEASGAACAISPNRYCLRLPDGTFRKALQHGMNGILPPEGERMAVFAEKVWNSLLTGQVPPEWSLYPLRRRVSIRSPESWRQARSVIPGIRPFGFLLSASSPKEYFFNLDEESGTFYGPYRRDVRASLKAKWLNTRTGKKVRLTVCPAGEARYFGTVPGEAFCSSVADFVDAFCHRRGPKMSGPDEGLTPVPVQVSSIYHVGKETNHLTMEVRHAPIQREKDGAKVRAKDKPAHVLTTEQGDAIRRLTDYRAVPIHKTLEISADYWRELLAGTRTPGSDLADRIERLSRSLPAEVPATFGEKCEAIRLATERMESV